MSHFSTGVRDGEHACRARRVHKDERFVGFEQSLLLAVVGGLLAQFDVDRFL
jgi:hypothetical protein